VVISKCGHILGKNSFLQHEASYSKEWARLGDNVAHCLAPSFLEYEITCSLERLGLETIDIFMLNNPERLLLDKNGVGNI
jgi:aryl-alcohol dehydrogenase-like predicted oxidoreductase